MPRHIPENRTRQSALAHPRRRDHPGHHGPTHIRRIYRHDRHEFRRAPETPRGTVPRAGIPRGNIPRWFCPCRNEMLRRNPFGGNRTRQTVAVRAHRGGCGGGQSRARGGAQTHLPVRSPHGQNAFRQGDAGGLRHQPGAVRRPIRGPGRTQHHEDPRTASVAQRGHRRAQPRTTLGQHFRHPVAGTGTGREQDAVAAFGGHAVQGSPGCPGPLAERSRVAAPLPGRAPGRPVRRRNRGGADPPGPGRAAGSIRGDSGQRPVRARRAPGRRV